MDGYDAAFESISEEKFCKDNRNYITTTDDVNPDSTKLTYI
ncbi:hypothetical protein [Clostridium sp.]